MRAHRGPRRAATAAASCDGSKTGRAHAPGEQANAAARGSAGKSTVAAGSFGSRGSHHSESREARAAIQPSTNHVPSARSSAKCFGQRPMP